MGNLGRARGGEATEGEKDALVLLVAATASRGCPLSVCGACGLCVGVYVVECVGEGLGQTPRA